MSWQQFHTGVVNMLWNGECIKKVCPSNGNEWISGYKDIILSFPYLSHLFPMDVLCRLAGKQCNQLNLFIVKLNIML